jgi:acetylornithine/succinyldiaminopimelate/putrescine aminotransferase
MAGLQVLLEEDWMQEVGKKEALFRELLVHPVIKAVRSSGLLMAVEFESYAINKGIIDQCIEKGLLTDWFLFAPHCMRVAPPLLIAEEEIRKACAIILSCIQ